ncbi:MAG: Ldh family oxidoreductase, partial [Candidatus Thorarchaeota archaeon]
MPNIQIDEIKRVCIDVLKEVGLTIEDAHTVVDCLIEADLCGISTHGVFRLPNYIEKLEKGLINANPKIEVLRSTPSTAVLDGGCGFGQVVGTRAMDLAIEKAKETGIGMVSVFNSNHFGMAAYFSMYALSQDMIGVAMSNANPGMAPFGGMEKELGTNPLSVAIPAKEHDPVVLDLAMSKVARGKIRLAAKRKERIPEGWAIDKSGHPTEDPESAIEGALLPFGGPKGSGLAIVIDILTGVLSGGAIGKEVGSMYDLDRKSDVVHTMLAIDIASFIPVDDFMDRVGSLIQRFKSSSPAPGVEKVYLPGMIE